MSTSAQRLAANRSNALQSTGPLSRTGKAIASRNATRHGILSGRLLLEDEDAGEFEALVEDLISTLRPVGAVEFALVDRIAVAIWRQHRLVRAERAALSLDLLPHRTLAALNGCLDRSYGSSIRPEALQPPDAEQVQWCTAVVAEAEALDCIALDQLGQSAPLIHAQLLSDAEEDGEDAESHAARQQGGLTGYVQQLVEWCQEQLRSAAEVPTLLATVEQVRARKLILTAPELELLARYQTTLDNQLIKMMRALREAQEWRLKTIEPIAEPPPDRREPPAPA